ncbi:hypothetical protein MP638_000284 [Amoeboaphelidium occidentale]|nr:hypothetical protein MP638_000284 [Amoeboaphelidium occidentale]
MIMMSKLSFCLSALILLVFVCSVYASPIGLKKRQEISELDEFAPASLLDTPLPASSDIGDFDFDDEDSNLNADSVLPELEAESVETEPETEQLEGFTEDEVAADSVEKLAEEFDMLEGNGEVENIEGGNDLVDAPAEVSDTDAETARTPDELPEETPVAVPSETQEEDEGFRFTAMPADFPATPTPVSDVEEYDAPLPTEEPVPVPVDEDYLENDDADTEKDEEEVDENNGDDNDETSEDDKVEENDASDDGSEAESAEETENDSDDDENSEKDDDTEDFSDVTAVGSGDSGSLTAQDDIETTSDQDSQTKPGAGPVTWVWFVVAFAVVGLAAAFFAYGKPRRLVRYVQRLGETPNYAELRGNNPDIEMREGSWVH